VAAGHDHGHSHGRVDASIVRSRAGVRAVSISLVVLGIATAAQAIVFLASSSVALLADLIHNGGDALTAVPLGIAFWLRSARGERIAGLAVVLAIFVSACVALSPGTRLRRRCDCARDGGWTAPHSSRTGITRESTGSFRSESSRAQPSLPSVCGSPTR
jgi:hypothetical protein